MALRLIFQTVLLRRNPSLDKCLDSKERWTRSDLGLAVDGLSSGTRQDDRSDTDAEL
jgi:hypothetical protein